MNLKNARTRTIVAGLLAVPLIGGTVFVANAATDTPADKPASSNVSPSGTATSKLTKEGAALVKGGAVSGTVTAGGDTPDRGTVADQDGVFTVSSQLTEEGQKLIKDGPKSGSVTVGGDKN